MNAIKCFDIATIVTDEATRRFSPFKKESAILKKMFKEYCGIIDRLAERFDGGEVEIKVDENTANITIKLDCVDPEIRSAKDDFYKLVGASRSIFFEPSKCIDDGVLIGFVMDGFWVEA